jgi:glutamate synthase domain-containing protein 3
MEAGKTLTLCGTPGNALGAYLKDSTIVVYGNAQDATGDNYWTPEKIVVYGNSAIRRLRDEGRRNLY